MIQVGDTLPDKMVRLVQGDTVDQLPLSQIFKGKRSVVFTLPGAFTPVCSSSHLPSYVKHFDEIKAKGIDQIICLTVNDSYVIQAWAKSCNAEDKVLFLADEDASVTKALGLELDLSAAGLGLRTQRGAMVVSDNVVASIDMEETPKQCTVSSAADVLKHL